MPDPRSWRLLRRTLVALLVAALAAQAASRKAAMQVRSTKPSVLLLILPGIGDRLGRVGGPRARNVERFVEEGRLFQNVYAAYPAAPASRLSLMTGRRPDTTGIVTPPEALPARIQSLNRRFRAAGYRTIRVGPLYGDGSRESSDGWDVARQGGEAAGRSVAELLAANRDESFLMVAVLGGPVPDLPALPAPAGAPRLPAVPAIAVTDRVAGPGSVVEPAGLTSEVRRSLIATFDARIDRIDAQLGEILGALDRLGLRRRLVVALASDVGPDLGVHGALPRTDDLVDVYPTLLVLCGLEPPRRLDGRSLMPSLREPWASGRRAAFAVAEREAGYVGRSIRTSRYRYTEWPDGSEELYDHDADPEEWTNLAWSGGAKSVRADLRGRLEAHQESAAPPPPAGGAAVGARRSRPNVLLVLLDDLTVRLGAYGFPDVQSPNIDRLARLGRRFDRAYAQVAMCSPSRTSLMTGWRPERIDLWTNALDPRPKIEGSVPLQRLFHEAGYFTARVGKVYHGPWEDEFHWDLSESLPSLAGPGPGREDDESAEPEDEGGQGSWWVMTDGPDDAEPDGIRARRVAELLGRRGARPFFVALGFAKPHLRWTAPRRYFDLYAPDALHLVSAPPGDLGDVPLIALTHHQPILFPGLPAAGRGLDLDEAERRRALAAYYACVSFVDAQVGVVLEALDRNRLWDDTVVVLLSDHGYHLGEHHLWRKDTLFEAALRTPLIVAGPGVSEPGVATRRIVELLDVYPTLAELAGIALPPGIDGRSLVPLLEDPEARREDEAFSFRGCTPPRFGRTIRTGRYRFTEWPDGSRELYDVVKDPEELRNLAAAPAYAGVVAAMKERLEAGPRSTAD
jgi:iduronate 2-sulfatase